MAADNAEPSSPTYKRLKIKLLESKKKNYGFFKPTDEVFKAWDMTKKVAEILGASIILFQSPQSFKPEAQNMKNMKVFFNTIRRRGDYLFCWEPRGNWNENLIKKICEELELIHVVDPFVDRPLYGNLRYYRLHGIHGYRYKYSSDDLLRLKKHIEKSRNNYFMFNNAYMYENALIFKEMLIN